LVLQQLPEAGCEGRLLHRWNRSAANSQLNQRRGPLCSRRLTATAGKPVRLFRRAMLVCNLGSTDDVAAITVEIGSRLEVKAVATDECIGGATFTSLLVDYFVDELKIDHNKDISTDPAALDLLRNVCGRAKKTISNYSQALVEVKELHFYSIITRSKFEEICASA
ncbi:hypothetical protein PENTCL1PPCAC_21157, partial [Pristionchus entomophagus]